MSCHRGPLAQDPCDTTSPSSLALRSQRAIPRPESALHRHVLRPRHPPLPASDLPTAATASLAWPRGRSFRHAFTSTLCSLDPRRLGYSPRLEGPRAARRLLQSRDSVSTPTEDPSPASSRQAVSWRSPALCATPKSHACSTNGWAVSRSGASAPLARRRFRQPTPWRPLARMGLNPNPIDPDTPVANS